MLQATKPRKPILIQLAFFLAVLQLLSFSALNLYADSDSPPVSLTTEEANIVETFQTAIRQVAREATPAVVNIKASVESSMQMNPFFHFFFKGPQQMEPQHVLGTGFIFSPEGYIITNNHVVENATEIQVTLQDGREYSAELLGTDPLVDLAVIRIESDEDLPYARIGDSQSIEVGDFAIAIGNPFGLTGTVTFGVISAKGRTEIANTENPFTSYIQTDAPINRGNSGGPLLNINGEVIGVNTIILSQSGGNIGIGFAIPINIAKRIADQLVRDGKVTRGYLGVVPEAINSEIAEHLGIETNAGVIVSEVVPGSPAEEAGIEAGDVITKIGRMDIHSRSEIFTAVANLDVGSTVSVEVIRNKRRLTVQVTIASRETEQITQNPEVHEDHLVWMGFTIGEREIQTRRGSQTVLVILAVDDSIAGSGIRCGDLLLAINYDEFHSLNQLRTFVERNEDTDSFMIQFRRGNRNFFVVLRK
jgi:serine protease Do